ncbi:hypothetical protein [Yersinia kristensenii]|uniref:hypothetical protein n=1 Tax=Yersinia kristensenii TaxID=28152 RepID=UPI000E0599AC|nr:hypothetical protein [Yersinia kristensenii]SUP70705.1 Uncharacterised protein [Yersinia kristensenii]
MMLIIAIINDDNKKKNTNLEYLIWYSLSENINVANKRTIVPTKEDIKISCMFLEKIINVIVITIDKKYEYDIYFVFPDNLTPVSNISLTINKPDGKIARKINDFTPS